MITKHAEIWTIFNSLCKYNIFMENNTSLFPRYQLDQKDVSQKFFYKIVNTCKRSQPPFQLVNSSNLLGRWIWDPLKPRLVGHIFMAVGRGMKSRCWEGRVMLETVSRDGEGSPNQPPASRVLPSLQSYLSCPCPEQS